MSTVTPLGKLAPFWRCSAALGPFHEEGQALEEIPDCMLQGDFPYCKRPYPKEVPFADHLSMVRLLGGFNDGSAAGVGDPAVRARDLAYRTEEGDIRYRLELLRPRLQPYLDCGYTDLTLVLDNVPWCFPSEPKTGGLGQCRPPRDPEEWRAFIEAVCQELVKIMGREAANRLRFRVGTENGGRARFDGTHEEYVRHYDYTAAALRAVLPQAKVGPYNISGVSLRGVRELHNVRPLDLAEHCFRDPNSADGKRPTPLDFIAYSRYFRPGDDARQHAKTCRQVWEAFEQRVPELRGVSREIHEFGIAPWGEVAKGIFASAEPGALGAATTCQMMWRLREAGIDRLWHWGVLDKFRDRQNRLRSLPTSTAWLLSLFDSMAGGEAFVAEPVGASSVGTRFLLGGSRTKDQTLLMASACNSDLSIHTAEWVRFRVPASLLPHSSAMGLVRLNKDTSVHDQIRRDLAAAGLLNEDFLQRPERLGTVRQMGRGRDAECLVGERLKSYSQQWARSLTLTPLTPGVGTVEWTADEATVALKLAPPEVAVLVGR